MCERSGSTPPYVTPFDVADPVNTPAGLDTSDPAVGAALADAVTDLTDAGIPLDAPLGTTSTSRAGPRRSRSTAARAARAPST